VYRAFTRIGVDAVPDAKTILKIANALGPEVITDLHQRIVDVAKRAGGDARPPISHRHDGRRNERALSDRQHAVQDGVRVLTREMRKAEAAMPPTQPVRDRRRSVGRLGWAIRRQARSPKTRDAYGAQLSPSHRGDARDAARCPHHPPADRATTPHGHWCRRRPRSVGRDSD
jgi:hypothetical protein